MTLTDLGNRVAALVLLILLAPLLLLVALSVALLSRGPVLYSQERIGQFGRPFRIWKFRTMRPGSDAELAALLAGQGKDLSPFFKVAHDPRITRVGRVLRATSLDELPQLVNVLRGDMNLVGPRPQSPAEVSTYHPRVWRRLLVKPGLTGLWQVSGRSDLSAEEGLELDLDYVSRWSVGLDLKVLARTPFAVIERRGAY